MPSFRSVAAHPQEERRTTNPGLMLSIILSLTTRHRRPYIAAPPPKVTNIDRMAEYAVLPDVLYKFLLQVPLTLRLLIGVVQILERNVATVSSSGNELIIDAMRWPICSDEKLSQMATGI